MLRRMERSKDKGEDRIQLIMIAPESDFEQSGNYDNQPAICKLRHPKSGQSALYMFTHENRKLLELMMFGEGCRSWFIGEAVQKDGSFYMASPVDPLFLVLPYLSRACKSGKFMELECILEDSNFPESKRLSQCSTEDLELVADIKGISDCTVYRYNKDKTLPWLQLKVDRVIKTLKENRIDVSSGAVLSTFLRSNKPSADDVSHDGYLRYAAGLIAEYLDPELSKEFFNYIGVTAEEMPSTDESTFKPPSAKKCKTDVLSPTEDYSQANSFVLKKPEKLTAAQKQLNKVDKAGIKSISSFFSSKTKTK